MEFRITNDGNEADIAEIYKMLKDYNLSNREKSENVPLGIFLEDENGKKQAPVFYTKLGYKEVFSLQEYPYTGARYYYTKEL